jgi:hypothetical protein
VTIRLPLDAHSSPPLEIRVGLPDDGIEASVHLELELHPSDFVGAIPERREPDTLDRLAYAEGDEVGPLRDRIAELLELLEAEQEYAEKLRSRLESVKAERSLWRELLPEEARALGSMLWHYADRASAPR